MIKSTTVVLGLLLVLAGCSDADDGTVTAAALPANLCEVVPAAQVQRWDLVEDTHSTDNGGPINSAECAMSAGSANAARLEVSVDSLGGGDPESATRFTAEQFAERCGNVRSQGEFVDTRDECTATRESDGALTLTRLTRLPDSYSVVWVQLVTPLDEGDAADAAIGDVVEAVRSRVEGASA